MTTAARRARAELLLMMRVISKTPHAEAWRAARPNAKCNDSSAGELVRRELRWLDDVREREAEERRAQSGPLDMLFGGFNSGVMPDMMFAESEPDETNEQRSAAPQKAKRCEGVAGRQCEQKIPALRNQKRCAICSKETRKLQKQGYNRTYYQANRVRLCKKLRERRNLQSLRDLIKEERERRAALPRVELGPDNRLYLYR